eukprot:TRINITY_DN14223_c0_g1_i1.p1 TRINITY_DN14223_c0_g1~~TRINITY_DN14223_c0_g1_i1.p1  ORF type:complete len:183 (-),score=36.51 TRINITY_DN14223_c0_g1_i1:63-611(-)
MNSINLLKELYITSNPGHKNYLDQYNRLEVNRIIEETKKLPIFNMDPNLINLDEDPTQLVNITIASRNKRIIYAYLNERLQRIKRLRWERGNLGNDIKEKMSEHEKRFLESYNELLSNVTDLDLVNDMQEPPFDINIEVVSLIDMSLQTEDGLLALKKDSTYFLKRTVAEPLIRQGKLIHVN